MRRIILPALLLLLFALPSSGQYSRYGGHADRDASRTVARWYGRFLDREADPYSATWVQALQRGQEPEQVLSGILGSDEYYRRAGSTPEGFVRQLFLDLVGNRPTPRQMDYWTRQLYHRSRADVAYAVLTRQAQNWDWDDRDRDHSDRHDYRRPYSRYR